MSAIETTIMPLKYSFYKKIRCQSSHVKKGQLKKEHRKHYIFDWSISRNGCWIVVFLEYKTKGIIQYGGEMLQEQVRDSEQEKFFTDADN